MNALIGARHFFKHGFNLVNIGTVGRADTNFHTKARLRRTLIDNFGAGNNRIRNRNLLIVTGSNQGASYADVCHFTPFTGVQDDVIAGGEGLIKIYADSAEKIGQQVLGG